MQQGLQALQRNNAATGQLGGAATKEAEQYGQGLASTNYQQAYNNALQGFNTNQAQAAQALSGQSGIYGQNLAAANTALGQQQGIYGLNFNTQNTLNNQGFNRLASIAGLGQGAVGQSNQAAQNYGNTSANLLSSQGQALAAGTTGAAGAYGAGLTGLGNSFGNIAQGLGSMYQYGRGGGGYNASPLPGVQNVADPYAGLGLS